MASKKYKDKKYTKTKIAICIIIIIIIILLLMTSCNSNFFGRIGNIFGGKSNYVVDKTTGEKKKKVNTLLTFENGSSTISTDDTVYKILFNSKEIKPKEYTCTTSDADIATCLTKDDYVEVYPKKAGEVTVYVQADVNGEIYVGTHKLVIDEGEKGISLTKTKGTVYLSRGNTINIPYYLNNITGDVQVEVENEEIASAKAKKGVLEVKALKTGKTKITLIVEANGQEYSVDYILTVQKNSPLTEKTTKKKTKTTTKRKKTTTKEPSSSQNSDSTTSSSNSNKPSDPTKPGSNPTKPSDPTTSSSNTNKPSNPTTPSSNPTKPSVPTTPSSEPTSKLSNNAKLNNIIVTDQVLEPSYKEDKRDYVVNVASGTTSVNISGVKKLGQKITYTDQFGNDITNKESLNVTGLQTGNNKILIKVTSEDGKNTNTYSVNIIVNKSGNNYLGSLSTDKGTLSPTFDKDKNDYVLTLPTNETDVNINFTASDQTSNISYTSSDGTSGSESPINVHFDDNDYDPKVVTITVKAQSGATREYKITVKRPKQVISFIDNSKNFLIEDLNDQNPSFVVAYQIKEDGIPVNITDEEASRIVASMTPSFDGSIDVSKNGIIKITPAKRIYNNETYTLEAIHNAISTTMQIVIDRKHDYKLDGLSNNYEVKKTSTNSSRNIRINTNIFNTEVNSTNITGGIKLTDNNNEYIKNNAYVEIISDNPDVLSISYDKKDNVNTSSSYTFKVNAEEKYSNPIKVTIRASIYDEIIVEKEIYIHILSTYNVVIDAGENGFIDLFTNSYSLELEEGTIVKLADYKATRADEADKCLYYSLDHWEDNDRNSYAIDYEYEVHKDITFNAKYENVGKLENKQFPTIMYLTDVDIFKNDEYYEKHGIEKMIYPGAMGSHQMDITNTLSVPITIKKINLEENTVCVGTNECINMGYYIDYDLNPQVSNSIKPLYPSDGSRNYQILHKISGTTPTISDMFDYSTSADANITLQPKETVIFYLKWKWVDNDAVDTKIGEKVDIGNEDYKLTVSIEYEYTKEECNVTNTN